MRMDKYRYSYDRTPNYCYLDSDVLINKFDIRDGQKLSQYERQLVAIRSVELIENPIKGNFDFEHLKEIHKYLFQDLYYWAGEVRTCNIAKRDLFCLAEHINSYADSIFLDLKKNNYLIYKQDNDLIVSLVQLFGDINALHPFREGNGRCQRVFLNMIARVNGININFINVSDVAMIEASHEINNGNDKLMLNIFKENAEKISATEQESYIHQYIKNKTLQKRILKKIVKDN